MAKPIDEKLLNCDNYTVYVFNIMVGIFSDKQDVNFIHNYTKSPIIMVTATHSSSGGSVAAECNGIVSWIEVILNDVKFSFF